MACRFATVALLASASALFGIAPAAEMHVFNRPEDVKAIMAVEEAGGSTISLDEIMSYIAKDAVFADLSIPDWLQGSAQIRAALASQFDGLKTLRLHIKDENVATDGKMGCVAMQVHIDATVKDNAVSVTFRELDAFRKANDRWEWVVQQVSFPIDGKTGLAVTDGPLPVRGPLKWAPAPLPGPAATPEQGKLEIKAWLDGLAKVTAIDDMMRFYGPDDDLIVYDQFLPGEYRGLQELHDAYAQVYADMRDLKVQIPSVTIYSDGLLGVMTSRQNLTMTMKGGATQNISFRQTDCLRRSAGKWHAFYEMVSFPIDKKTGKPAPTSSSPAVP